MADTTTQEEAGTARLERMLVGGAWFESSDGRTLYVENPAVRGSAIAQVPRATAQDVDRAVRAAAKAFEKWRAVAPRERATLLLRIADDIERELEGFARLLATETGNAIRPVARPEVKSVLDVFRYFGGLGSELKGETVPLGEHMLSYTRREPYGVVGAIVPWNVPLVLAAVKIAPALVAGNTMVLKPASDAPLAVLKMAGIAQRHLPFGVLNVVTGTGEEAGMAIASHPQIAKLSFTGNTETGKAIMRAAAERVAPTTLELGGKSPAVVFPDVDDDKTVEGVMSGMRFTRQGQSCTAGSRLLLHEHIFDSFLAKLAKKLSVLKVGDPLDESTDVGAIVNRRQFERVCEYVAEGMRQEGARVVAGGLPPSEGPLAKGYFALPTVIANVSNDWRIAREEIFGPVLVAIPWNDLDEAVDMANASHYGLAAYVWTHDIGMAISTAHRIDSGWVQVNQGLGQFPGQSYGGYKQSGMGREYSLEGMLESYTQRKSVTINLRF